MNKTLLIDRDGVINKFLPKDYVKSIHEYEYIEENIQGLITLSQQDFSFIVITNQSCINRKIVNRKTIQAINKKIMLELSKQGINILDFFICPHIDEDNCNCRKPKPGSIFKALKTYNLKATETAFIGDSHSDYEAAKNANVSFIGLSSGNPSIQKSKSEIPIYSNLSEAISKAKIFNS